MTAVPDLVETLQTLLDAGSGENAPTIGPR